MGTWERRRADLYALAEDWLGPAPDLPFETAVDHLTRRYLAAFGPATRHDLASWSGLPLRDLAPSLDRIAAVQIGGELLDLPGAPLPPEDSSAPVRLLPIWDATLLVHARRTQLLPEEHRPRIFNTKIPHSLQTFLLDGRVAGTWRFEHGEFSYEAFDALDRASERELLAEGERFAALYA